MKLTEKIMKFRKENERSQEDFAEKLGVSRQEISRQENGSALPDAQNILQISKLFHVTTDYLLNKKLAVVFAIAAAALYAINIPLSKLFLSEISPAMLAGFLYLGAGVGMAMLLAIRQLSKSVGKEPMLTKEDLPFTVAMILLDIAAPIFLMFGIAITNSSNVSLLSNLEIVATSVIALALFKEKISRRLWTAILLVVISSIILSVQNNDAFLFNQGSLWVLCACTCWGLENNCTRRISNKNSEEIVLVKGIFSGLGSLIIALRLGNPLPNLPSMLSVMLLGFVSYGLSINLYIRAQKYLGAAKTSAFYSVAPFLGVAFGFLILGELPDLRFYVALFIMIISTFIMIKDTLTNNID